MSKIKLTLPNNEIPVTGKQVTFTAPCDCSVVECLQINDLDYTVVNAIGESVTGTGAWISGAMVTVVLDVENTKAYIQNGNTGGTDIPITSTPDDSVEIWIDPDEEYDEAWYTKEETEALLEARISDHNHDGVYAPAYTYSTTDLTAGTSSLETGKLYLVYE